VVVRHAPRPLPRTSTAVAVLGPDDRLPCGSGSGPAHWVTQADDRIGEHGATVARIR
jgi:hypothetical protein